MKIARSKRVRVYVLRETTTSDGIRKTVGTEYGVFRNVDRRAGSSYGRTGLSQGTPLNVISFSIFYECDLF